MDALTGFERVANMLAGKPVDYLPCYDAIWGETIARWRAEGSIGAEDDVQELLGMDIRGSASLNYMADPEFVSKIIEENEDRRARVNQQ